MNKAGVGKWWRYVKDVDVRCCREVNLSYWETCWHRTVLSHDTTLHQSKRLIWYPPIVSAGKHKICEFATKQMSRKVKFFDTNFPHQQRNLTLHLNTSFSLLLNLNELWPSNSGHYSEITPTHLSLWYIFSLSSNFTCFLAIGASVKVWPSPCHLKLWMLRPRQKACGPKRSNTSQEVQNRRILFQQTDRDHQSNVKLN